MVKSLAFFVSTMSVNYEAPEYSINRIQSKVNDIDVQEMIEFHLRAFAFSSIFIRFSDAFIIVSAVVDNRCGRSNVDAESNWISIELDGLW